MLPYHGIGDYLVWGQSVQNNAGDDWPMVLPAGNLPMLFVISRPLPGMCTAYFQIINGRKTQFIILWVQKSSLVFVAIALKFGGQDEYQYHS